MAKQSLQLAFLFTIFALGCGQSTSTPNSAPPPQVNENSTPGIDPNSPRVVTVEGWTGIDMIANYAETKIGMWAHYTTGRNGCFKEAYGAISLKDWNELAKNMNLAIQKGLSNDQDYCVPIPEESTTLQQGISANVQLPQGNKHILFEIQEGNQICSSIRDHKVSNAVLHTLDNVIAAAYKEDAADCISRGGP